VKLLLLLLTGISTVFAQFVVLDLHEPTKAEQREFKATLAKVAKLSCEQQADFWAPFARHPIPTPHVDLTGLDTEYVLRIKAIEIGAERENRKQQEFDEGMWNRKYFACQQRRRQK